MPSGKKRIRSNNRKKEANAFPIVGIGASAGGLDAIGSFFEAMPDEFPEMACVVISHLDPSHSSILPELLQKHTQMEVHPVKDGMEVQPRRVYVIPPDRDLRIENGRFWLTQFQPSSSPRAPINHFFRSLAEQQAEMPEHLIGYVDRMLKGEPVPAEKMSSDVLKKIHGILRTSTGHDFSYYKNSTVQRRIGRRMNIHGIEHPAEYASYLQKDPQEATSLIKELLIGVTNFFRDPEAFESLKKTGLAKLVEKKPDGYTLRAWVAGCATGEEAYTLGIILREYMDEYRPDMNIQIFATDLDADAVHRARAGLYAGDISTDVNAKRLKRFFKKENNGYKVRAGIRESIVFAKQSVIKDPPFTKLDLICCRNLLIYLDTKLQKRLLPLFHHSLNPKGILFLGASETIGEFTTLFSSLNDKWKIYQRKAGTHSRLQPMDFPFPLPKHEPQGVPIKKYMDITDLAEKILLDGHTPPAMIIDANGDIRYIHGRMHKYLEHAQGPVRSYNAFEMARKGLKIHLIATMRKIRPESGSIKKDIQIEQNGHPLDVRVTINPMPQDSARGFYMVVFEEVSEEKKQDPKPTVKAKTKDNLAARNQELEQELKATRDKLRTTLEELESANEALRSANEEYQSANEELQSANAERIVNLLETDLGRRFQQLSSKYDLGDGQLDIPQLRKALEEILPMSQGFENYEIEWDFPGTGRRKLRLNARRIHEKGVAKDRILLAMQRVTEKE